MSAADTPSNNLPNRLSSRDLARVDVVLKDMNANGALPQITLSTPPLCLVLVVPCAHDVMLCNYLAFTRALRLKQFDQSTATSRLTSQSITPPRSVVGIGGKVAKPDYSEAKIVLAMVGLPARGKSYLSNKLMRYLKWLEYDVKVFNVGQLRRSRARQKAQLSGKREDHTASYLARQRRGNARAETLASTMPQIAPAIGARIQREGIVTIFLESVCDDPAIIAANVALKVSSGDPDYKDMSRDEALADFLRRIKEYEAVYETITEPHLSYLRLKNVGSQVTLCHIHGYLQSRIAFYLMNLHLKPRSIFFSRHGESQFNVEGKIGGDSFLSERGMRYASALPALITDNIGDAPLTIWTSTLQRTIQTGQYLPYNKLTWKSLTNWTLVSATQAYPEDFANRDEDKFNYRYRGGESYRDVVVRLEPVIMELERQENILIIGHQVWRSVNPHVCTSSRPCAHERLFSAVCKYPYASEHTTVLTILLERVLPQPSAGRPAIHQDSIAHRHQADTQSIRLRRGEVSPPCDLPVVYADPVGCRYTLPSARSTRIGRSLKQRSHSSHPRTPAASTSRERLSPYQLTNFFNFTSSTKVSDIIQRAKRRSPLLTTAR
ncbi:Fructose-2,6-bisphosphatase [Grifola frondosa]|uniref:Fructose-2,6-bisphosphatase n=1 Tax=Grifola frondosa TaxID=5627 RepID=A0A1C7MFA9_GRIFR|nr:Fructose-2,6-bisphosphatase [Grifola frondosa]